MSHTDNDLAEKGPSHVLSRPRSRRLLTICEIAFLAIALLIPACGGFYRYNYYSYFQQGYCTITSGEVTSQHFSNKNGGGHTEYYARLSYTVFIPGTNGATAQGYDGPDHSSFYSYTEAQDIVDQYPIGATVACWYNPDKPTDAVLVFKGYTLNHAWSVFGLAIVATGVIGSLPMIIWYNMVRLILVLRERGQLATGTVTRHKQYRSKNSTYTISVIRYTATTIDHHHVQNTIQGPGHLRVKSKVSVCYDPYRPRKALYGGYPTQTRLVNWIILALVLLTAISVGASLITFMIG